MSMVAVLAVHGFKMQLFEAGEEIKGPPMFSYPYPVSRTRDESIGEIAQLLRPCMSSDISVKMCHIS